ncbi:hypothetical protein QFC19_000063 [Naganishia cerealis]|uniref:Uncharacterized protein n=1 Tax=Naganishia cerealis TaxID=610337 RepID=A0ACC2WRF1_9TREE|nr:hypothetical protein QFC19_000063 [Naganishia cerealis]
MVTLWSAFTARERRDIGIYIFGIMCYKFALEYYNGAFITLANERFPTSSKYTKVAMLTGLNSAMQCVGSILIAPLIKRLPTRTVLSGAVIMFGLISTVLLICDAATGGKPKMANGGKTKYGSWNPNGLFPIYVISGIAYGMVELIRRVIPRDIVGGDVIKLRKMDAIVHVMYEVAGTIGAFTSTSLIGKLGYNYSSIPSPILFCTAGLVWRFVSDHRTTVRASLADEPGLSGLEKEDTKKSYMHSIWVGVRSFGKSFYFGLLLVCSSRKYIWLLPGYSFALYGHRYLENGLAPIFAKQILGVSSWSQIIVGGSNFGELLGALSVLLFSTKISTPIPWLRLDALALNLVWILPFIKVTKGKVAGAWRVAGCFIPISYGWAAGDVSLAAYIQSSLAKIENIDPDVSALGAVMAFLYVTYIVMYAVISSVLGRWVDKQLVKKVAPQDILKKIGGIQFSILCVIVLLATLIPRGALSFNPKVVEGANSIEEGDEQEETPASFEHDAEKKSSIDLDHVHGHQLNKMTHGNGNDKLAQSSL